MAAIVTTERATGRRSRIAMRRAPRPVCARGVSAPITASVSGPLALAPASPAAEAHASPVRVGGGQAVGAPTGARCASAATFRRRRFFALVGLIGALVIVGQAGAALGGPSLGQPASQTPAVHRYVVRAGDSLWGAASHLAPNEDPRAVVDALVHARGNGPLMSGEVLRWQG